MSKKLNEEAKERLLSQKGAVAKEKLVFEFEKIISYFQIFEHFLEYVKQQYPTKTRHNFLKINQK